MGLLLVVGHTRTGVLKGGILSGILSCKIN
jgi:hypothetical protein